MEQKLWRFLEISWPCPSIASLNIKPLMITSAVVDGPKLTHQNLPEQFVSVLTLGVAEMMGLDKSGI